MRLHTCDTNILIDLEEGRLLEQLFQLPYEFRVPDILFSEELEVQHAYLSTLGLQLSELTSESMLDAADLLRHKPHDKKKFLSEEVQRGYLVHELTGPAPVI